MSLVVLALWLVSSVSADSTALRIALGSCAHQDSTQEIWDRVIAWEPDLFVHLGDAVYADTRDSVEMAAAYDLAASRPAFIRARERIPFLSTWDDHDYGENDAGAAYPMREVSESLFFRFWSGQAESRRVQRPGVYGSRSIVTDKGTVRVVLLDTRSFRSDWTRGTRSRRYRQDPAPEKTLLGEAQWAWLDRELQEEADVLILASSIQVVNDEHGWECWGNFPRERQRLFDLIVARRAEGLIVLSGDRHFSELSKTTLKRGFPLYDFTASGLTQVARNGHKVPNSRRIGAPVAVQHFGGVVIDFGRRRIVFETVDGDGTVRFSYQVSLDTLRFESGE